MYYLQGCFTQTSNNGCHEHRTLGKPSLSYRRTTVLLSVGAGRGWVYSALQSPVQSGSNQGGKVLQSVHSKER